MTCLKVNMEKFCTVGGRVYFILLLLTVTLMGTATSAQDLVVAKKWREMYFKSLM